MFGLMAITPEDRREIKELFAECLVEHMQQHGLDPAQHSKDHAFMCELRTSTETLRRAGIWTAVTVVGGAICGALWIGIKHLIRQ